MKKNLEKLYNFSSYKLFLCRVILSETKDLKASAIFITEVHPNHLSFNKYEVNEGVKHTLCHTLKIGIGCFAVDIDMMDVIEEIINEEREPILLYATNL